MIWFRGGGSDHSKVIWAGGPNSRSQLTVIDCQTHLLKVWSQMTSLLREWTKFIPVIKMNFELNVWNFVNLIYIFCRATLPNLRPTRCLQACKTRPYLARIMNVLTGFGDQITVCLVVVRFGSRWSHFADNWSPNISYEILKSNSLLIKRMNKVHSGHENEFWAKGLKFWPTLCFIM